MNPLPHHLGHLIRHLPSSQIHESIMELLFPQVYSTVFCSSVILLSFSSGNTFTLEKRSSAFASLARIINRHD